MNFDEFEKASDDDLRREAQGAFDRSEHQGDTTRQLIKAQFYLQELERRQQRREQSRVSRRDLILEVVVIFLEVVVIVLIAAELYYSIHGGNQQLAVLDKLSRSTAATAKTLEAQWQRENQKPDVMVMVLNTADGPEQHAWSVIPPFGELSAGGPKGANLPRLISVLIRNIGNAPLRRPRINARAESPGVVQCFSFRYYNPGKPCKIMSVALPDLEPDSEKQDISHIVGKSSDYSFFLYVTFPRGTKEIKIHLVVSGDNLSTNLYSVNWHVL